MAWHNRYIKAKDPKKPSGGLRTNVTFIREDLLWRTTKPILDPYTGEELILPKGEHKVGKTCYGANILDILERTKIEELNPKDNTPQINTYWQLRDPDQFFAPLKERKDDRYGELLKKYCAGGTVEEVNDNFIVVSKRSSVSVNALVYKLAIGMTGNYAIASRKIGEMAANAWANDLIRAKQTYQAIVKAGGKLLESELTINRATSTISQQVETAILRECCYWLDVDPDEPTKRERGQPRKYTQKDTKWAGKVIELEIKEEGEDITITGKIITSFEDLAADTTLSSLTLLRLVYLLASLKEDEELAEDAELLENYLDAVDENWQEKAAAELEEEEEQISDDPRSILDVSPDADFEEIKRQYRQLMKKVHPDTSSLPAWISQKVNQAYSDLTEES